MYWGRTVARSLALAGVSVAMGLLHNYVVSPRGIRLGESPLLAVSGLEEARFIDLEEAKVKWGQKATFVDARAEEFYTYEGHIRGAVSVPYYDLEAEQAKLEARLPDKDEELVCYCSGYGCEESAELAKRLIELGYTRVYVFEGGWPVWSEAGLPVERPADGSE